MSACYVVDCQEFPPFAEHPQRKGKRPFRSGERAATTPPPVPVWQLKGDLAFNTMAQNRSERTRSQRKEPK